MYEKLEPIAAAVPSLEMLFEEARVEHEEASQVEVLLRLGLRGIGDAARDPEWLEAPESKRPLSTLVASLRTVPTEEEWVVSDEAEEIALSLAAALSSYEGLGSVVSRSLMSIRCKDMVGCGRGE